jgi:hypothetical protein
MSTVPITCPNCGAYLRVSVQPCSIEVNENTGNMWVKFDDQIVAHTCHEEDIKRFKERKKR